VFHKHLINNVYWHMKVYKNKCLALEMFIFSTDIVKEGNKRL